MKAAQKRELTKTMFLGTYYPSGDCWPRPRAWLKQFPARYANIQVEKCPTTDRIHYQFYLSFEIGQRTSTLCKKYPGISLHHVIKDNGASSYCLKEDTRLAGPWEIGIKPV